MIQKQDFNPNISFQTKTKNQSKQTKNKTNEMKNMHILLTENRKDLSNENEPIRASRLSNREVMLSAAVLHNMNMPSSSTSGDYNISTNRMSSISSKPGHTWNDKIGGRRASNQAVNCVNSSTTSASTTASKSSVNDDETDTNSNDNDDLSISQYELDIVNKYLNELCSSDESNDQEKSISENIDEQLINVVTSNNVSGGDDDESQSQSPPNQIYRLNANDQCSTLDMSIESDTESQSLSQSQSQDARSVQPQPFPVSNSSANDEIQCTVQTSRQLGFDQSIQINAMINQPNRYNTYDLGHTLNDVNNNNISLSSNTMDSHNVNQGLYSSGGRRPCSNYGRTNPIQTRDNQLRTSANIPIIVGIASCVWGLFFYAVKSFYSDLT